ncbi:Sulfotransferase,P-loop containing nucleoside triphosphate hydrolase [Cinara cedri]|uniref:Sulfotransferase,P-loop containing nucleoside triphosphate hydrolase n=1 Tax=Cinara cedri TaxID=506608 RepID=A0A5E4MQW9_9HEMI|nr:Sulfotransferase,P-loop containing nucleoside triphosphate hydrolase [Cinara cedri]
MFFRVRHQKMMHVYLVVFVLLSVLVVLGAYIAYHVLLRQQHFQIQSAVSKLMHSDNINRRFKAAAFQYHHNSVPLLKDQKPLVIYNRVPKTGSTSFVNVAYDLHARNSFRVLHVNVTGNSHLLSLYDQFRFIDNTTQWLLPAFYHGHFAYIDFERYGYKKPHYIQLLRKPLDRLVSYYYFLRYGDDYRPHLVRKKHMDSATTFDECVDRGGPDCQANLLWLQIPFLCGQSADCWTPGSEWALRQAKRNVLEKYTLVGVTEKLTQFLQMLELVIPGDMFRNASEHFQHSSKSHLRKTAKKYPVSRKTVKKFHDSTVWQMENELYTFVAREFAFAYAKQFPNVLSKDWKSADELPPPNFHYEKIYPKPLQQQKKNTKHT